ncbi:MAG: hypothetical protein JO067_06410 [Cupriavidus sp.]|nr:hypothetical protein [Cupriavidus sp.]
MSTHRIVRTTSLIGAMAAGLMSAAAFAQGTTASNDTNAVPPGMTQIQPPKDPLVERREARKVAKDQYHTEKSAAKSQYDQEVGAAKQERHDANKAANETAKQGLQQQSTMKQ